VPKPLKARRNEPLFVKYTAQKLAEIRGMSLEEIAQITTANTINLFLQHPQSLQYPQSGSEKYAPPGNSPQLSAPARKSIQEEAKEIN
jgi:hypothetical protein